MDTVSFITAYESGELEEEAIVEGFQALIDSGLAWQLQGSYGRVAHALVMQGLCRPPMPAGRRQCKPWLPAQGEPS
jgi:hypothetical protein